MRSVWKSLKHAPAKDLKLLQREHKESVQESEEANTKVMQHGCTSILHIFDHHPSLPSSPSFSLLPLLLSLSV